MLLDMFIPLLKASNEKVLDQVKTLRRISHISS